MKPIANPSHRSPNDQIFTAECSPPTFPRGIRLQIVWAGASPPESDGWLLDEIQHDGGHRLIAIVAGGELKLIPPQCPRAHRAVSRIALQWSGSRAVSSPIGADWETGSDGDPITSRCRETIRWAIS